MSAKLDNQLAKLQQQIANEHGRFIESARAIVTTILAEFGLTLDDLTAQGLTKKPAKVVKATKAKPAKKPLTNAVAKATKGKTKRARGPQPPKYRDPVSGATWSGMARPPSWIAGVKDRTPFLINGAE